MGRAGMGRPPRPWRSKTVCARWGAYSFAVACLHLTRSPWPLSSRAPPASAALPRPLSRPILPTTGRHLGGRASLPRPGLLRPLRPGLLRSAPSACPWCLRGPSLRLRVPGAVRRPMGLPWLSSARRCCVPGSSASCRPLLRPHASPCVPMPPHAALRPPWRFLRPPCALGPPLPPVPLRLVVPLPRPLPAVSLRHGHVIRPDAYGSRIRPRHTEARRGWSRNGPILL